MDRRAKSVIEFIGEISDCVTEDEVNELAILIVQRLGGKSFVYTSLLPSKDPNTDENFRFFIGCDDELCRVYSSRKWIMNDPFFEYAKRHNAPITGSKIKTQTSAQQEMLEFFSKHGFRSGLVVPTHTPSDSKSRMGVLYVGSDEEPQVGEPKLLGQRILFQAMGMELLLWWNRRLRSIAMRRYSVDDEELELMRLFDEGRSGSDIGVLLNLKKHQVYKLSDLLTEKFNVERMAEVLVIAKAEGLL